MNRLRRIARRAAQLYRTVWRVRPFAGVYPHVRDVPVKGAGFASADWVRTSAEHTARVAHELAEEPVPRFAAEAMALPLLAAVIHGEKGRVSILDVGGAAGIAYVQVRQVVPPEGIDYHLVDNATVLDAVRRGGYLPPSAGLYEQLPESTLRPDIVHAASVVQYVEDYRAFFESLARYEATYIALINSPIGDMPTCAAAQVSLGRGSVLPFWFLNAVEVLAILESAGYKLIFSSACERDYDLSNLPAAQRLNEPRNLIFRRQQQ